VCVVCQQDYCKSNHPISLKVGIMIRLTSRKNRLTFGGESVSDRDSESLFHFPEYCRIGHFRRFISISHTVSGRFFFTKLCEITDPNKGMNPLHFGSDPADTWIRINREICIQIPDHFWLTQPKFKGSDALGVGGGLRFECSLADY